MRTPKGISETICLFYLISPVLTISLNIGPRSSPCMDLIPGWMCREAGMPFLWFHIIPISQIIKSPGNQEETHRLRGPWLVHLRHYPIPMISPPSVLPGQTTLPSSALRLLLQPYQGQGVSGCQEIAGGHHMVCSWSA